MSLRTSRALRHPALPIGLATLALVAYGPVAPALATGARGTDTASRGAQTAAVASRDTHRESANRAPAHPEAESHGGAAPRCRHQTPISYLVRSNYLHHHDEFARSVRWRTEHYGYFEGFGNPSWNAHPPRYYAREAMFMGLSVQVNRQIIPALQCVEAEIRHTCSAHPYRPHNLAGIRFHNTYRGGEITNHAYGIAIDVDPENNTCCHCVGRWAEHPLCRRPTHTIWQRMVMPECWVNAFERFGFYWLGHDALQDTMHFEFLADPDRILEGS